MICSFRSWNGCLNPWVELSWSDPCVYLMYTCVQKKTVHEMALLLYQHTLLLILSRFTSWLAGTVFGSKFSYSLWSLKASGLVKSGFVSSYANAYLHHLSNRYMLDLGLCCLAKHWLSQMETMMQHSTPSTLSLSSSILNNFRSRCRIFCW